MNDGEAQDKQDAELATAEADETPAVPAEDPTEDNVVPFPGAISVTATGLFVMNFREIFDSFKTLSGYGTTVKAPGKAALLAEAAKYAAHYTDIQLAALGQGGQQ